MKEIDLYSEAKPRYYQLIPNREDGLILLALYQKQEFTEDQIIQIINKVLSDLRGTNIRDEGNRNNNIIYVCKNFFCGVIGKEKYMALKTMEKNFAKKSLHDCLKAITLPK